MTARAAIEALEAALAAGPHENWGHPARQPNGAGNGWEAGPAWLGGDAYSKETAADAALIAAANPAAIRSVLARVRELEAALLLTRGRLLAENPHAFVDDIDAVLKGEA